MRCAGCGAGVKGSIELPQPKRQVPGHRGERGGANQRQAGHSVGVLRQHLRLPRRCRRPSLGPEAYCAVIAARHKALDSTAVKCAKHGSVMTRVARRVVEERGVVPRGWLPPSDDGVRPCRDELERVLPHLVAVLAPLCRLVGIRKRLDPVGVGVEDGGCAVRVESPYEQLARVRRSEHLARIPQREQPLDAMHGGALELRRGCRLWQVILCHIAQRTRVVDERLRGVCACPERPCRGYIR
mmetsp:Transcript_16892/g.50880  ORF Transcript_16892/g.50880 Transcript_16892/m.50880 type:complete len:241 (-) Transcript_16892:808-1530(-)